MRLRKTVAAMLLGVVLSLPGTASAVDWAEWKRLIRERPVATVLIMPAMVLTSPFMLATWAFQDSGDSD